MFKLQQKEKVSVKVKGWWATPIQYEIRVPTANWSPFFGHYQNQRWGAWDSDSCWCLSAINSVEDQMEWLWKNGMFSQEAKDFFTNNGYIDSDGDFSLSERYHEILCGNKDNGGSSAEAWQSFQKRGFIPRSMLTYTLEQSNQWSTKAQFVADYFNPSKVTEDMLLLGTECRKYVNIAYQTIGKNWTTPSLDILNAALKQAPLCIGIPIPVDVSNWNNSIVQYDGGRSPSHEVELYGIDANGEYLTFDQYLPNLKTLSANYYIPLVTQGIIYATPQVVVNPIPQPSTNGFWTTLMNMWNNAFSSFKFGHA